MLLYFYPTYLKTFICSKVEVRRKTVLVKLLCTDQLTKSTCGSQKIAKINFAEKLHRRLLRLCINRNPLLSGQLMPLFNEQYSIIFHVGTLNKSFGILSNKKCFIHFFFHLAQEVGATRNLKTSRSPLVGKREKKQFHSITLLSFFVYITRYSNTMIIISFFRYYTAP